MMLYTTGHSDTRNTNEPAAASNDLVYYRSFQTQEPPGPDFTASNDLVDYRSLWARTLRNTPGI